MNWQSTIITRLKRQWFILALLFSVTTGLCFPNASMINKNGLITGFIVMLVFLGMGMNLPSEALLTGLKKFKAHLFLQTFIFILTPAIVLITSLPLKEVISREMYTGLLALSVLPTTISTCVIFTQLCEGDTVLSLFNASLSNIIGVFWSPILLSLFLSQMGRSMPLNVLLSIITSLALKIILPLMIGQIVRRLFITWAKSIKAKVNIFNNILILIIVFFSLSKSAATTEFNETIQSIVLVFGYLILIFFTLSGLSVILGNLVGLRGEEKISVLFVAPQKTLAMGVPLLTVYFADDPRLLGIAIIPLLFYHPWQLLIGGIIKSLPITGRWLEES